MQSQGLWESFAVSTLSQHPTGIKEKRSRGKGGKGK